MGLFSLLAKMFRGATADRPAAARVSPLRGMLSFFFDTTTETLSFCSLASGVPEWQTVALGSFVTTGTLTARGDLLVRGASAPQRLALGTNGYVLTSNGTDVVWAAASGVALSSTAPVALGSANAGAGATAARTDHVHPTTGLAVLAAENTYTQRQIFGAGALVDAGQVLTFQTGSNSIAINQGAHTFASARTVYFPDASGEIMVTGAAQTATARMTFAAGLVPFVGTVAEIGAIGSPTVGLLAFATNGRTGAEGAGLGTGCPVYYGNGQWRRFEDGAVVAA